MKKIIILFCIFPLTTFAWDGYDYDNASYIEIGPDNLIRTGNEIEIYDYSAGEYRDVEIQSINKYGNLVEIKIYDEQNKMSWDEAVERMEFEGLDNQDTELIEDYIEENSIYERTLNMDL